MSKELNHIYKADRFDEVNSVDSMASDEAGLDQTTELRLAEVNKTGTTAHSLESLIGDTVLAAVVFHRFLATSTRQASPVLMVHFCFGLACESALLVERSSQQRLDNGHSGRTSTATY